MNKFILYFVAIVLGIFVANILKDVCGCNNLVEGQCRETSYWTNSQDPSAELICRAKEHYLNIDGDDDAEYCNTENLRAIGYHDPSIDIDSMTPLQLADTACSMIANPVYVGQILSGSRNTFNFAQFGSRCCTLQDRVSYDAGNRETLWCTCDNGTPYSECGQYVANQEVNACKRCDDGYKLDSGQFQGSGEDTREFFTNENTCSLANCPVNTMGDPPNCACAPGYTGSVTARPGGYTVTCGAAFPCPDHSSGNPYPPNCTCDHGFTGTITPIVGGYRGSCVQDGVVEGEPGAGAGAGAGTQAGEGEPPPGCLPSTR
uniref:Uncharacterized protein n=1 Tax=viral metagenome TaxID=1070528 RepID=A0A6C0C7F5_9ZZZZ